MATNAHGLEEIMQRKSENIARMRDNGVNPYPYTYNPDHSTADVKVKYDHVVNGDGLEYKVAIAGRVMSVRSMGKVMFVDVQDQHGKIQAALQKDVLGEIEYNKLKKIIDRGDFLGVKGNVIRTRRGELTILGDDVEVLSKALRPLPSKEYSTDTGEVKGGVSNDELRYRQPEVRMIMNPGELRNFEKKSKVISIMREVLDRAGYMEVEIPILQPVYGGASARPFVTKLNAYNQDVYMSISPELYLKRLIVAGFLDGVYTICKNFRNEGVDRTHNPEFTMMECYKPYWDYLELMNFTENMISEIFTRINGTPIINYSFPNSDFGEQVLDFHAPFTRARMTDLVRDVTGIDVENMSSDELRVAVAQPNGDSQYLISDNYDRFSWGEMVQLLFEAYVEDTIIQPTFVIDHPKESTPLCKAHRDDDRLIERFEMFCYGMELTNAYSELNDPELQRKLLQEQSQLAAAGDEEAHQMDEDFCRSIEYGMPPAAGLGIGIDRLAMFVTGTTKIRDIIPFPMMKPGYE